VGTVWKNKHEFYTCICVLGALGGCIACIHWMLKMCTSCGKMRQQLSRLSLACGADIRHITYVRGTTRIGKNQGW
jgi:hypothetical protein